MKLTRLILLISVCLSGCVTQKPVFNDYQVTPRRVPKPVVFDEIQKSVAKSTTNLTVPPPPVKPVYLAWDYPFDQMQWVEYFKVYHSGDIMKDWRTWELYGTTDSLGLIIYPTNVMDFFYCTAYGFGSESAPNTK